MVPAVGSEPTPLKRLVMCTSPDHDAFRFSGFIVSTKLVFLTKLFQKYEREGKDIYALSEEDQFMWLFGRVERLQQRLRVMIFIGNFQDHCRTIGPQLKVYKIS